jgi:fructokinase
MTAKVLVIGEALVDVVKAQDGTTKNIPGGSPANTAVALAKLGINSYMKARSSTDQFGEIIRNYLLSQNVNLDLTITVDQPSSIIDAEIQLDGSANYSANLLGASDYGWSETELLLEDPERFAIIHLASLTSYVEPGATNIEKWFGQFRQNTKNILSFDPNIRHPLDGQEAESVRARAKRLAGLAHIVKASDEDLTWINKNRAVEETAEEFIALGAKLVIVTLGKNGSWAINAGGNHTKVNAAKVNVIDTIGAGDTFSAALLTLLVENSLCDQNVLSDLSNSDLNDLLVKASAASAITCSRQGANPPLRSELDW